MKTLFALVFVTFISHAATQSFDVVVYGGTAGGVVTAVSAAREGLKTALIEPGTHIGGMVSGGLGRTDYGKKEVIGGYSYEFYLRAGRYYQTMRYGYDAAWMLEPHVAEEILRSMLREAKVQVFEQHRLREKTGVTKSGAKVMEIAMENGVSFAAKIFADATYEGDLMAQAGVSYTWGRESVSKYGESLAGVRAETPQHQFLVKIPARGKDGKQLPEISPRSPGAPGSADKGVQAYNFRMCFSEDPANQSPFIKPAHYDPARYELLARYLEKMSAEGKPIKFMGPGLLPNAKADINNSGAFSTDYIGGSWDYPEANYARRAEIWEAHKEYQAGFFFFLANDPRVPEPVRKELLRWGLCKDEFLDTGRWPHQLYIREARRMVGEFVVTQKDLQTELTKPDPIGMGSYNSDSHNIQRVVTPDGNVMNEGDVQVAVKPYQIPYRVMVPKRSEAENLLVPVCFSASHVAYSSLRMEPQYMIIGQAAGVAAKMAIESGKPVQAIDTAALTAKLRKQGAVMEYVSPPQWPASRVLGR